MSTLLDRLQALFAPAPPAGDPAGRARWRRSALVGWLLAAPIQVWMLTAGTWDPMRWERVGDFYDAQARAIRHGALAMDPWVLGIEAFYRGENAYMYFGPVPAAFRLPVVALTDRFEGRLTVLSFIAALIVLFVVVRSIGWQLRVAVLGDQRVGRLESATVGALVFGLFAGSAVLYLSSRTWVYHEASIWGMTFTLGAFAATLLWLSTGARRFIVRASVWTTLAICTRASVAGGAVAALTLCLAGTVLVLVLRRRGEIDEHGHPTRFAAWSWVPAAVATKRSALLLPAAIAAPLVAYATVNYIKFRSWFSVPFEAQAFTQLDPTRQQMLDEAGGSLFNLRFLAPNTVQYWRPDMLGVSSRWPWITFPQREPLTFGAPQYDLLDLTAGIPIAMPALVTLGLVGSWFAFRRTTDHGAHLRIFVIAGLAGTFSVLSIGYVANRYHGDFMPLLVMTAFIGLPVVIRWASGLERPQRRAVAAVVTGLVAFSAMVNISLAYTFQRAYGPGTAPNQIADYLDTQIDVGDTIGDGPAVEFGDRLPESGAFDDVFVLGDCDGLYWSDGMLTNAVKRSNWNVVETRDGVNGFAADLVIDPPDRGMVQPLFSLGGSDGPTTIFMVLGPGSHRIQVGYWGPDGNVLGPPIPIEFATTHPLDVIADRHVTMLEVRIGGRVALSAEYTGDAVAEYGVDAVGVEAVDAPFGGSIVTRSTTMPTCERLLERR